MVGLITKLLCLGTTTKFYYQFFKYLFIYYIFFLGLTMDNNNNNNKILVLNFLGQLWIHNEKKYYNNKKLTINIVKGKNK